MFQFFSDQAKALQGSVIYFRLDQDSPLGDLAKNQQNCNTYIIKLHIDIGLELTM